MTPLLRSKNVFCCLARVSVLGTLLLPATPAVAFAAAPPAANDSQPSSGKTPSTGGTKRFTLDDDILVEGKLDKPSAFYVFRRSSTAYDWARLDAQFTQAVLESVQDPLF